MNEGQPVGQATQRDEEVGASPLPRRRGGLLQWALVLLALAASAWFLARVIRDSGPQRVLAAARDADPLLLLLMAAAIVARFGIWSWKWGMIVRRIHPEIRKAVCFPLLLAGTLANLLTPTARTAGGILRAWLLASRHRRPFSRLYGTVIQDQVTNFIGFGLVACLSLALLPFWYRPPEGGDSGRLSPRSLLLLALLGLAGLALQVILVAFRGPLGRLLSRPDWRRPLALFYPALRLSRRWRGRFPDAASFAAYAAARGAEVFDPLLRVGETRKVAPLDIGLGALVWLGLCLANYLAFLACGARPDEVPFFLISAILSAGNAVAILTTVPGGVGVTEASMIGLQVLAGVRPELAAASSLLFRLAYYLFILAAGGVSLAWATRGGGKARPPAPLPAEPGSRKLPPDALDGDKG